MPLEDTPPEWIDAENADPGKSAVAVLQYGRWPRTGLRDMKLDEFDWPLGRPQRLVGKRVKDLAANDHIVTYPRNVVFWVPRFGIKANISVMIVESDAVHAHHLRAASLMRHRFHRILTKNRPLLDSASNARFFIHAWSLLSDRHRVDRTKSRLCSIIASDKTDLPGHRLRHRVVSHIQLAGLEVDVMGRGYRAFDDKEDGLARYRYSVVVENSQEPSYFTEKLIDALICGTVPIYWGAPNVADFFDPAGLMLCESEEDVQASLARMSDADFAARAEAIEKNRVKALEFANWEERVARLVLS